MARLRIDRSSLKPSVRRSTASGDNVVPFDPHHAMKGGVDFEREQSGRILRLSIMLPQTSATKSKPLVAPEAWIQATHLAVPFAEALLITQAKSKTRTARRSFYQMGNFFKFLSDHDLIGANLHDLGNDTLKLYIAYLTKKMRTVTTRRGYYGTLKGVLEELRKIPAYAQSIHPGLRVPANPWGSDSESSAQRGIPITELVKIERACLREIASIQAKLALGRSLAIEWRTADPSGWDVDACLTLGDVLAAVRAKLNGCLADLRAAYSIHPALGKAVEAAGGVQEVNAHLHLSARAIIPFLVLFCCRTAFNPETCFTISRHCVRPSPLLSSDVEISAASGRIKVNGKKGRASFIQTRTFPANDHSPDNPVVIVRVMNELTAPLRAVVDKRHSERLFIYRNAKKNVAQGFDERSSSQLYKNLKIFISDNKLEHFTLAQIRQTISELVDILTSGDVVAKQTILGHRYESTTDSHYASHESRERRRERLGEYQNQLDRWVATGGRSEPRQSDMGGTRRAATGGFECADPYDSPIEGEIPGRLCQAWGHCATCPLAGVDPRSAYGLARLIQLENAVDTAKREVSNMRWIGFWQGILEAIRTVWLPLHTDESVWVRARQLYLPPMDIIE